MWIPKKKWKALKAEVEVCKNTIAYNEKAVDRKIYAMAKKILRQPEELSKEIEEQECMDEWIKEFMKS